MTDAEKLKKLQREVRMAIRPFVAAKKYNPNNSLDMQTMRTLNVKAIDIVVLKNLLQKLDNIE
jgi:hypothetical protein